MGSRLLTTLYLASWGSILLDTPPTIIVAAAASIRRSYIADEVKRKPHLLSDNSQDKQVGGLVESSPNSNPPLTAEQFENCFFDEVVADTNMNFELDKSEFLNFLIINSARYGYSWDYPDKITLSELPLEFPLLFHSTACLCAYEEEDGAARQDSLLDVDFGCCLGENEHIAVYESAGLFGDMSDEEYAYSNSFCAEAYYLYPAFLDKFTSMSPTNVPSFVPTTDAPTASPSTKVTTLLPTEVAETYSPTEAEVVLTFPPSAPPVVETDSPTPLPEAELFPTFSPSAPPVVETDSPTPLPEAGLFPTFSPSAPPVVETDSPTPLPEAVLLPTFSPSAPPVVETDSPTPLPEAELLPTFSPSASPVPIPAVTPSPTLPIVFPTFSPDTGSPTLGEVTASPTFLPTVNVSSTSTLTELSIEIQYDYNSDCGVTADDVMSGNDGIELKEGLIIATEAIVVDILNSTYPRDDASSPAPSPETTFATGSTSSPIAGATLLPTLVSSSDASAGRTSPTTAGSLAPSVLATVTTSSSPIAGETLLPTLVASSDASTGTTSPTTFASSGATLGGTPSPSLAAGSGGTLAPSGLATVTTSTTPTTVSSVGMSQGDTGTTLSPSSTGTNVIDTLPLVSGGTDAPSPAVARSGSNSSTESFLRGFIIHSKAADEDPSARTPEESLETSGGLRTRVDGSPGESSTLGLDDDDSNDRRLGLVVPHSGLLRGRHHPSDERGQRSQRRSRSLVYYTQTNPVVIADVEDVVELCPSGYTCMRITTIVTVTLEEGDDPAEVEEVIRSGFEESIQDASFFEAFPADAVTCPVDDGSSPAPTPGTTNVIGESLMPTSPSSADSVGTILPTTLSSSEASGGTTPPTTMTSSEASGETPSPTTLTSFEVSGGTTAPPIAGAATLSPTYASSSDASAGTTSPPTSASSEATLGGSLIPTTASSSGATPGGNLVSSTPTAVASVGGTGTTPAPSAGGTGSGTSNTIDAAIATPSPSLPSARGGGMIVTPTIRDGGGGRGGGEMDYYMMMGGGDMASIHSEKLRLKDQPS